MKPNLVAESLTVSMPLEPGLGQLISVASPHELLAALLPKLLEVDVVAPHREVPQHFLATVFRLDVPNVVDCLVFSAVE